MMIELLNLRRTEIRMGLFSKNRKKDPVQSKENVQDEEKLRRVEGDMAYLEAQVRLFRKEQREGA